MTENDRITNGSGRLASTATAPRPLSERVRSLRLPQDRSSNSSGGGRNRLAWVLCLLLACSTGGLAFLLFTRSPGEATESEATTSAADGKTSSLTRTADAANQTVQLESKGYIIPAHQILVTPKVSGKIVKLYFNKLEEGQIVEEGKVLAEIEDIEYRHEYNRALALLQQAKEKQRESENGYLKEEILQSKAEFDEAEEQVRKLASDHDRNTELLKKKAITDSEYLTSETNLSMARKRRERLKFVYDLRVKGTRDERLKLAAAETAQAQAELDKAQWRLDNCRILAPITGTILKKNAEEGNIVNPVAFNGNYSLCEMADLAELEIDLNIQERDVSRVFQGQKCRVRAEAYPDRMYLGCVSRLMPIADRAKGAIPVRVKVHVPKEEMGIYLKPEMGVIVSFLKETCDPATKAGQPTPPAVTPPAVAPPTVTRAPAAPK